MTVNELRLLNKKLNQRMVRMEKTAGSPFDLTKTPEYRRLQKLAQIHGVSKKPNTKGLRFKEKGLEKMMPKDLEKLINAAEKAVSVQTSKRGVTKDMKETMRRLRQGGIKISESEISDFYRLSGGRTMKRLAEHYDSEEIIEILRRKGWKESSVNDMLDIYEAYKAKEEFDEEEFYEFVFTGELEGLNQ